MADLVTNTYFEVVFIGAHVGLSGHFTAVSGLSMEFEYETYNEGGANYPRQFFKNVVPQTLVLEQGTLTAIDALSAWIATINTGVVTTLNGTVNLKDPAGSVKRSWTVVGAFPVLYSGPSLDGMKAELAVTRIELRHNGCF